MYRHHLGCCRLRLIKQPDMKAQVNVAINTTNRSALLYKRTPVVREANATLVVSKQQMAWLPDGCVKWAQKCCSFSNACGNAGKCVDPLVATYESQPQASGSLAYHSEQVRQGRVWHVSKVSFLHLPWSKCMLSRKHSRHLLRILPSTVHLSQ